MPEYAAITTEARVATPTPERYVTRLCTHFAHKTDVSYADGHGQVDFADGTCTLDAEASTLVLRVTAEDVETVARLEHVVEQHLRQFAEGREVLAVSWAPVAPA